jgi:uncharacterized membrane protein YkoI
VNYFFPRQLQKLARHKAREGKWSSNMIKQLTAAVLATAALATAQFALADKPAPGWITIEKAIEKAKSAGYTEIYKIEADDHGYWEGEGRKADSVTYEFRIDATSGNVLRDQKD